MFCNDLDKATVFDVDQSHHDLNLSFTRPVSEADTDQTYPQLLSAAVFPKLGAAHEGNRVTVSNISILNQYQKSPYLQP